jgi:hypothetical protein
MYTMMTTRATRDRAASPITTLPVLKDEPIDPTDDVHDEVFDVMDAREGIESAFDALSDALPASPPRDFHLPPESVEGLQLLLFIPPAYITPENWVSRAVFSQGLYTPGGE